MDALAILDGSGITITNDMLVTRTLHKHGLMRSTPITPPVPPLARTLSIRLGGEARVHSMNSEPTRKECWPKQADSTGFLDIEVFLYKDSALIYPPDVFPDEDRGIPMKAEELRTLAKELEWAAERLESR